MIFPRIFDEADLVKIEINTADPVVLRLIENVRSLRDENDHLRETVMILGDELDELRTLSS